MTGLSSKQIQDMPLHDFIRKKPQRYIIGNVLGVFKGIIFKIIKA